MSKDGSVVENNEALNSYFIENGPWSPDSKGFLRTHYKGQFECSFTEFMLVKDDGSIESTRFQGDSCIGFFDQYVSWSLDGTKVAFVYDIPRDQGVRVYSSDGTVLGEYSLPGTINFIWIGANLLVAKRPESGFGNFPTDFVFVAPSTNNVELIYTLPERASLLAYHSETNEVMILAEDSKQILIFDLSTNTVKQQLPVFYYDIYNVSSTSEYTALQIDHTECEEGLECPEPPSYALWIFDWVKHSLEYYGEINNLLGWYTNLDGFLVAVRMEDINDYNLNIVLP